LIGGAAGGEIGILGGCIFGADFSFEHGPTTAWLSAPGGPSVDMIFLDLIVPRSVIAGLSGRYPRIAGEIENITSVESLAKLASTLTRLALMGTFLSQSTKISAESSLSLTSSERRILNRSLGYSGSSANDVAEEGADVLGLNKLDEPGVPGSEDGESNTAELVGCG
jgi:hypothetical protein